MRKPLERLSSEGSDNWFSETILAAYLLKYRRNCRCDPDSLAPTEMTCWGTRVADGYKKQHASSQRVKQHALPRVAPEDGQKKMFVFLFITDKRTEIPLRATSLPQY